MAPSLAPTGLSVRNSIKRRSSNRGLGSLGICAALAWVSSSFLFAKDSSSASVPEFLKDVRFSGEVARDGWKGRAVYTLEDDNTLAVSVTGAGGELDEVGAELNYKSQGIEPDLELVTAVKPSTKHLRYLVRLSKTLPQGPQPRVSAAFSNDQAALETSLATQVIDGIDTSLKLEVPYSYSKKTVHPAVTAESSADVGGGRLVGSVTKKAGGASEVSAKYNM